MAFTAAKEICSQAELNRFACAFLNCKDVLQSIDWDAAAKQFDSAIKPASFKTVTQKAMKKVFAAAEGGEEGHGKVTARGKGGGAGGRKRKADAEEDGEGGETRAAKKGKGKGGKRSKKAMEDVEVAEEGADQDEDAVEGAKVKAEGEGEEDDELVF